MRRREANEVSLSVATGWRFFPWRMILLSRDLCGGRVSIINVPGVRPTSGTSGFIRGKA